MPEGINVRITLRPGSQVKRGAKPQEAITYIEIKYGIRHKSQNMINTGSKHTRQINFHKLHVCHTVTEVYLFSVLKLIHICWHKAGKLITST